MARLRNTMSNTTKATSGNRMQSPYAVVPKKKLLMFSNDALPVLMGLISLAFCCE